MINNTKKLTKTKTSKKTKTIKKTKKIKKIGGNNKNNGNNGNNENSGNNGNNGNSGNNGNNSGKSNKNSKKYMNIFNSNKSPFVYAYNSLLGEIDKLHNLDVLVSNFSLIFSPLSGSEPNYEPHRWNNNHKIKSTHNCYSYALDHIVSNRKGKPQPGYFARFKNISNKEYKNCKHFYKRLKKDSPTMYLTDFDKKCRKGYSKAFIALANKSYDTDYHFWRQDSNKYWSHKPGATDVTDVDADKKLIKNPYLANRDYGRLNYETPCFFFCRPHKLAKTASVS